MTHFEQVQSTLANHGMLGPEPVLARLSNRPQSELWRFLDDYRALYRSGDRVLIGDAQPSGSGSGIAIWPDHTTTDAWDLKLRAWSLWADRVFVRDPLLSFGGSEHLGRPRFPFGGEDEPLAEQLADALGELLDMLPFVEQGFVTLTGLELLREAPPEIPIMVPPEPRPGLEPAFETGLTYLQVATIERKGGQLFIPDDSFVGVGGVLEPLDALAFEFTEDGDGEGKFGIQLYAPITALDPDESARKTWSVIPADGARLEPEVFKAWATQQATAYVVRRLEDLIWELSCSATLNARFFTTSAANRAMATSQGHASGGTIPARLLDLELPFLHDVSLPDLAEFRRDSQAVIAFRGTLLDVVNLIQAAPESPDYAIDVRDARDHLLNSILPEMRREVSRTKWRGTTSVALATFITGLAGIPFDVKAAALAAMAAGTVAGGTALSTWHDVQSSPAMFHARMKRRARQEDP